jgi:hypothetical protein
LNQIHKKKLSYFYLDWGKYTRTYTFYFYLFILLLFLSKLIDIYLTFSLISYHISFLTVFLFLWPTGSYDWRWFLKTRFWIFHLMGRFVDFNPFLFAPILYFRRGWWLCLSVGGRFIRCFLSKCSLNIFFAIWFHVRTRVRWVVSVEFVLTLVFFHLLRLASKPLVVCVWIHVCSHQTHVFSLETWFLFKVSCLGLTK